MESLKQLEKTPTGLSTGPMMDAFRMQKYKTLLNKYHLLSKKHRKMTQNETENAIKYTLTPLFDEVLSVNADFTDEQKAEFVKSLEAKYGGKIELEELRYLLPFNIKDGD